MDELLRQLLNRLDAVGEEHEELYDTVCRDHMGEAVFCGFIRPETDYSLPDEYGVFSADGNRAVKAALAAYIAAANGKARELGVSSFHDRLAAFQNEDVSSDGEQNYYDDFFGYSRPEDFDADGNVIGR